MTEKTGWLINDCLTCIPGTTTFWHNLLDWFPNLCDKTRGYTDYSILADLIENELKSNKPYYIIRNGSYFRKINTDIKTVSIIQDVLNNNADQLNVIENSTIVTFNTSYVYEKYKDFITNQSKIRICPIGVDFNFFKPIDEKHPEVLPNSILFIGSSTNYPKGFNVVLSIIENMPNQNFCLIMKDYFSVNNLPIHLQLRVKIFNRVDQETVRKIINSCICAMCTSYEETQHLAGIECGACGIPIVARSVGVYFDCKNDKDWGLIADENNFIEKLNYVINNKNIFYPREYFIKKYSTEVCKKNWTDIINNL